MQCGQLGDLKARLKALGLSGRLNTVFCDAYTSTLGIYRIVSPSQSVTVTIPVRVHALSPDTEVTNT